MYITSIDLDRKDIQSVFLFIKENMCAQKITYIIHLELEKSYLWFKHIKFNLSTYNYTICNNTNIRIRTEARAY